MTEFRELARAAAEAMAARPEVPLALATLVQVDGSSYRQPGARLLVDAEGRVLAGAIGRVVLLDVWQLALVYRVLAFMALGVVLIVLGYIYTRWQDKIREWL